MSSTPQDRTPGSPDNAGTGLIVLPCKTHGPVDLDPTAVVLDYTATPVRVRWHCGACGTGINQGVAHWKVVTWLVSRRVSFIPVATDDRIWAEEWNHYYANDVAPERATGGAA